jgi:hypothetical protein
LIGKTTQLPDKTNWVKRGGCLLDALRGLRIKQRAFLWSNRNSYFVASLKLLVAVGAV